MRLIKLFIVFSFILNSFNLSCKKPNTTTGSDNTPPDPPVLVPKNIETDIIERGIDAESGSNGNSAIYLEWFLNSEKDLVDLAGYEIYRAKFKKESLPPPIIGGFELILSINVDPDLIIELDTTFIDENVGVDTTYYYYVRAFDQNGNTSEPSDTAHYTLIEMPVLLSPPFAGDTSTKPTFEWAYKGQDPGSYILRVRDRNTQNIVLINKIEPPSNFGGNEKIKYGEGFIVWIDPNQLSLTPDGIYEWRVDAIREVGNNFWGSESAWSSFRINTQTPNVFSKRLN